MQIQINDTTYPADGITARGEALSIQMPRGDWTLETLMEALAPGSAPQVRVLDEEGITTAIYAAHAVTELALTKESGVRVGDAGGAPGADAGGRPERADCRTGADNRGAAGGH